MALGRLYEKGYRDAAAIKAFIGFKVQKREKRDVYKI